MYQPTTVLITGAAGFIPSNVTCYLVQKYPQVKFVGIDKMSYCSNLDNLAEVKDCPNFTFHKLDLCDAEGLADCFLKHQFDTILHFAAYTHVDLSFFKADLYVRNNVVATQTLLEECRKWSIGRFIYVSTDEVYGSSSEVHTEDSKLSPTNPYSASKAAAEMFVMAYSRSFNIPTIITRGNNVYGPKQYPEKVIPKFILRVLAGHRCQIQGTGHQTRSFLYVDDVCQAFDLILHWGQLGIYNIGSDSEHKIIDLAYLISRQITGQEQPVDYIENRCFNDISYHLDYSRLTQLGWKQTVSLEEGLARTIDWYKTHTYS